MQSLVTILDNTVGAAFEALGSKSSYGRVQSSDRPDLAEFQCNGAMIAVKKGEAGSPERKNPRAFGEEVASLLKEQEIFESVEVAGPGFINLKVTPKFLASYLHELGKDPRFAIEEADSGKTVLVDYGGPNIAKALHAGHLRPALIGDSLRRIVKFAGYNTLGDVHLGDWGTPMGMILSELEERHPDWPYFDSKFEGEYPEESPVTMKDLEELYPQASEACKKSPERMERAKTVTVALQNKSPGYYDLWKHFVAVSIAGMKSNYEQLSVHFDLWKGEADVHDYIEPMVAAFREKGLAEESEGAWIFPVAKEEDKKKIPPLILYKKDGAVLYSTTDLATIVEREKLFSPAKIIYVVDQRQHLHFEQIFRASRLAELVPDSTELIHAGFGTMNGADGKPFKTRDGGIMRLEELISSAETKAMERMQEAKLAESMSPEEQQTVAHTLAIGALKFADLINPRTSDYVFDIDKLVSFEGKTGPYVVYQAVRVKSLLKRAGSFELTHELTVSPEAKALALLLTELPDKFHLALTNYTPHSLCEYSYRLAQEFSKFYAHCHILSEEDEGLRTSYLALSELTLKQLELTLSLLGISIPERM